MKCLATLAILLATVSAVTSIDIQTARARGPNDWTIGTQLGAGAFGTVSDAKVKKWNMKWLSMKLKSDSKDYVVKQLTPATPSDLQKAQDEVAVQKAAYGKCPDYVPAVKDTWVDTAVTPNTFSIVMEKLAMTGEAWARQTGNACNWVVQKPIATQLIAALRCLHSKAAIAHCDMKPDNFMLTASNNVKLIDFGEQQPLSSASASFDTKGLLYTLLELWFGAPANGLWKVQNVCTSFPATSPADTQCLAAMQALYCPATPVDPELLTVLRALAAGLNNDLTTFTHAQIPLIP